ncbi:MULTISPECIES: hypothetical protein [Streptomyces]|uniref:Lipoprotein n=2 Tax=Streptomyces TaxID=1883 RepID=I2MTT0_STRT9|nr:MULTISPECIES: hypothetical protein [Streptomyces]AZK92779.1 hypothetical protein B7R87_01940 [Streptomyces tsukubensis]EIF88177.1 hypothetical protein [Streptomyces tsukubensis NRRL18488]MYS65464.1 hypothetical protein [Streptomyces sp. SID5473]QKM71059.1 hypothetical protein STSU_031890 [Streptomyces tsukubensis NRRL18488]TAI41685.1 hypothetical protein EWI31_25445 [Streptomyces tsukubensis]
MRAIRLAPLAALTTAVLAFAAPAAAAVPVPGPVPVPAPATGATTGTDPGAAADAGTGAGADSGAVAEQGGGVTSFGFTVAPETVAPGGTVTLRATECSGPAVTASSGVFAPVTLAEGLPGTATVFPEAEPGTAYDITFDCQGERGTARLLVAEESEAGRVRAGQDPAGQEDGGVVVREPVPDSGTGTRDSGAHDSGAGAHDGTSAHRSESPVKPDGGVRAGGGGSLPQSGPERIAAGSALMAGAAAAGAVLFAVRRRRTGHGV